MIEEGPSTGFVLYDGSEFHAGEQVSHRLDEGRCWQATVAEPQWAFDYLRFLMRVVLDAHAAVKVEQGHAVVTEPDRLSMIEKQPSAAAAGECS